MRQSIPDRWSESISTAAFFSLTFFFFGPALLFSHNLNEFSFSSCSILLLLAGLALGGWIFCTLLLKRLPDSLSVRILALMLAIALLLWLQGNILDWDYGLLDGREIAWGKTIHRYWDWPCADPAFSSGWPGP
jgi:hypothetical protein